MQSLLLMMEGDRKYDEIFECLASKSYCYTLK